MEQKKLTAIILVIVIISAMTYILYCTRLIFKNTCVPCAPAGSVPASVDSSEGSAANYALKGSRVEPQDSGAAIDSNPIRAATQLAELERRAARIERRAKVVQEALVEEKAVAESVTPGEDGKAAVTTRTIVSQSAVNPVAQPTREQKARMRAGGIEIR